MIIDHVSEFTDALTLYISKSKYFFSEIIQMLKILN